MSYNGRYSEASICVISIYLSVKKWNIRFPYVLILSLYQGGNFIFTFVMAYKRKGSPRALVPWLISLKYYIRCMGISKNMRFYDKVALRTLRDISPWCIFNVVGITLYTVKQTQRYKNFDFK